VLAALLDEVAHRMAGKSCHSGSHILFKQFSVSSFVTNSCPPRFLNTGTYSTAPILSPATRYLELYRKADGRFFTG
jgi:hypothetical protein